MMEIVYCGIKQWLSSNHMGLPTDANAKMDTATQEKCLLFGPCRDLISRTVGMS
jgi:hypothetical protein